ncbi:MAG: diaminopimelate epimerase [Phycisphaerae bacterium]|nr:diaminopimelate epimerase [Phycisphaerae bacterium]
MRFTKMQGLGNDYLYLDAFAEPSLATRNDLHELTRAICDRHRGVGADGLIILAPHHDKTADVRMRMFNADGIDGGVCGNGTRCAAKFVADRGYILPSPARPIIIDAGPRKLRATVQYDRHGLVNAATVDMGPPLFALERIPVDPTHIREARHAEPTNPPQFKVDHRTACFVSMGNPHMVAFIEEPIDLVNLADEGPKFENHPAFPQRINYHIVNIISRDTITMRTWERGAGITQACATGACAAAAAGITLGRLDRAVRVQMTGGTLDVRLDETTGDLFMTGEAVEVFSGEWNH